MRLRQPVGKRATNRLISQCNCKAMRTMHYYYTAAIGQPDIQLTMTGIQLTIRNDVFFKKRAPLGLFMQ